jgi:hypothetical protein
MENKPTGRTRLKPITFGHIIKTTVLVHQTELTCEYTENCGGHVEVEEYTSWFNTKAEWLLEQDNETRGN